MSSYSHFLKFGCKHNPHGICAKTYTIKTDISFFKCLDSAKCKTKMENKKNERREDVI